MGSTIQKLYSFRQMIIKQHMGLPYPVRKPRCLPVGMAYPLKVVRPRRGRSSSNGVYSIGLGITGTNPSYSGLTGVSRFCKVYKEIIELPLKEREKLFVAIARRGFEKDFYTHEDVFGDIRQSPFTIREASEYLEVAEITVRRWVKNGSLKSKRLGRNIVFDIDVLKEFKKKRA